MLPPLNRTASSAASTDKSIDVASQLRAALTGKVSEAHVDTASKTIIEAYATGDRCWHTLEAHILPGLRSLNFIADLAKINDPQERAALTFGWIGHDCVYHARKNDNEEQSADTMGRLLRECGVHENTIETVKRLILVSKKHHGTKVDENIIILAAVIQLTTKTGVTNVSAYLYRAEAVYQHLQRKAKATEDYLNKQLSKVTTERNLLVQILSNQGIRIVTEEQAKSLGITNTSPNKSTA